jgi:hypothetical protein
MKSHNGILTNLGDVMYKDKRNRTVRRKNLSVKRVKPHGVRFEYTWQQSMFDHVTNFGQHIMPYDYQQLLNLIAYSKSMRENYKKAVVDFYTIGKVPTVNDRQLIKQFKELEDTFADLNILIMNFEHAMRKVNEAVFKSGVK